MKASNEEVRQAVIKFGNVLGLEKQIPILLKNVGTYSTIKELTLKAFTVNYQDYFEKDTETFDAIQIVREYCKEMTENGEVKFER